MKKIIAVAVVLLLAACASQPTDESSIQMIAEDILPEPDQDAIMLAEVQAEYNQEMAEIEAEDLVVQEALADMPTAEDLLKELEKLDKALSEITGALEKLAKALE